MGERNLDAPAVVVPDPSMVFVSREPSIQPSADTTYFVARERLLIHELSWCRRHWNLRFRWLFWPEWSVLLVQNSCRVAHGSSNHVIPVDGVFDDELKTYPALNPFEFLGADHRRGNDYHHAFTYGIQEKPIWNLSRRFFLCGGVRWHRWGRLGRSFPLHFHLLGASVLTNAGSTSL